MGRLENGRMLLSARPDRGDLFFGSILFILSRAPHSDADAQKRTGKGHASATR